MNLNPGDKIRVVKEYFFDNKIVKPGTVLEVIWGKGNITAHVYRCLDQKGRVKTVHVEDVAKGCVERIFEAPAVKFFVLTVDKLNPLERELFQQVNQLKDLQNILAKEKIREISMIEESKRLLQTQCDEKPAGPTHNVDLARLRDDMRKWLLAIQFSSAHAEMRKDLQAHLKELTACITTDTSHPIPSTLS